MPNKEYLISVDLHSVDNTLIQLNSSLCRTFGLVIDKLSITTVIFIRSKNKPSITATYMYLGTSEHML